MTSHLRPPHPPNHRINPPPPPLPMPSPLPSPWMHNPTFSTSLPYSTSTFHPPSCRFGTGALPFPSDLPLRGTANFCALPVKSARIDDTCWQASSSGWEGVVRKREIEEMDIEKLSIHLRELVSVAEESVTQIANLANIELGSDMDASFVSCSYNHFHRMPSEALFHHSLRCRAPSEKFISEISEIASSMNYYKTINHIQSSENEECTDSSQARPCCDSSQQAGPCYPPKEELLGADGSADSRVTRQSTLRQDEDHHAYDVWCQTLSVLEQQSLLTGSRLFYKDTPAVVQLSKLDSEESLLLPEFANIEFKAELASGSNVICSKSWNEMRDTMTKREISVHESVQNSMLPSTYWLVAKEISSWKQFPTHYTPIILEAALGLGGVKRKHLKEWLLAQSPLYGLILDSVLAEHMIVLLVFCLRASHREAIELYASLREAETKKNGVRNDQGVQESKEDAVISSQGVTQGKSFLGGHSRRFNFQRCQVLLESGHWLASHIVSLCGPVRSIDLVLGLYKHAFTRAAWVLAQPFLHPVVSYAGNGGNDAVNERKKGVGPKFEGISTSYFENGAMPTEGLGSATADRIAANSTDIGNDKGIALEVDVTVSEGRSLLFQIAAAIAAIKERALFNQYNEDALCLQPPKYQALAEYLDIVKRAEEERRKRPNIRPVLEHDGLTWHRTQKEEARNKTKEELLAEERDYKRRRMSYRGKKLKRTATQVIHDIIEGHMREIIAAGGIGCLTKRPAELPTSRQGPEMQAQCLSTVTGNEHSSTHEDTPCPERRLGDCALKEPRQRMNMQDHTSKRISTRGVNGDSRHGYSDSPDHRRDGTSYIRDGGSISRVPYKDGTREDARVYEDRCSSGRRHHSRSHDRDENYANRHGYYRDRFERWDCSSADDQYDRFDRYEKGGQKIQHDRE